MERQSLTEDLLFLACTRPAMWHGVPLEALAINGMATGVVFVMMANPFYLLIGVGHSLHDTRPDQPRLQPVHDTATLGGNQGTGAQQGALGWLVGQPSAAGPRPSRPGRCAIHV